jgi:hypothetical protein
LPIIVSTLILLFGYFTTLIPGDVYVNFGAIQQVRYLGSWPSSVVEAWDLRGIINKLFIFVLDFLALNPPNITQFTYAVKLIYIVFIVFACFSFASVLKLTQPDFFNFKHVFLISFLAFLSCSNSFVIMQAELNTAIFCLLLISLNLLARRNSHFFAVGLVASLTFGFKGITVLTGVSALVISTILIQKFNPKNLKYNLFGFAFGITIYLFLLVIFIPQEIRDLMDATLYQDSFNISILGRFKILLYSLASQWPHVPFVLVGFASLVALIFASKGEFQKKIILLGSLILGLSPILIQSKGFAYHLTSILPWSIVTYFYTAKYLSGKFSNQRKLILNIFISTTLILPTSTHFIDSLNESFGYQILPNNYAFNNYMKEKLIAYTELKKISDANCDGSILYLDAGMGAFVLKNKSYLRQTYPLSLQRESGRLSSSQVHFDNLRSVSEFSGNCILIDYQWFFGNKKSSDLRVVYSRLIREFKIIGTQNTNSLDLMLLLRTK